MYIQIRLKSIPTQPNNSQKFMNIDSKNSPYRPTQGLPDIALKSIPTDPTGFQSCIQTNLNPSQGQSRKRTHPRNIMEPNFARNNPHGLPFAKIY